MNQSCENSLSWATKIFNTINTGIVVIDPQTNIIKDINDKALVIIGKSRNDIVGHPCSDSFCNGCTDKCTIIKEDEDADLEDFESHIDRSDGSSITILKTLNMLLCEGKKYLIESFIDISALKSNMLKLKESETRAQTYLDVAPALVIALDLNGTLTMINKYGLDILECGPEVIGVNWFDVFISEIDRPDIKKVFADLTSGRRLFSFCENEIFTLKGNKRVLAWRNAVLKDTSGDIVAIIAAGNDITEQRIAECELERHWANEEERLEYTLKNLSILTQGNYA